jgi:hypothetical protein
MKRNLKNWMTKATVAVALGAGMLIFAAPQASAQSRTQRFENEQLQQGQERNLYNNRAVNPRQQQQEQRRFTYQQPYQQHGFGQYGYGQYGQYGTYRTPQPYYSNENRVRRDDDDRYYQRNNRR